MDSPLESAWTSGRNSTRISERMAERTALHRSSPLLKQPSLPVLPTEANYLATPENGREGE